MELVGSASNGQAGGLQFKPRHSTAAERRLAAMLALYTSKGVTPEVNPRSHINQVCLCQSVNKAANSNSPQIQIRGINSPTNRHVSNKNLKKDCIPVGCVPATGLLYLACGSYPCRPPPPRRETTSGGRPPRKETSLRRETPRRETPLRKETPQDTCLWKHYLSHWQIQGGGEPGTRAPLGVQILSFSCSFQQIFEK